MNTRCNVYNSTEIPIPMVIHRRPQLTFIHLYSDLFCKESHPESSEYLQGL